MTERDPSRYVFWLASRSAGIVAFVLVATSVVLGLYMAANLGRRPGYKRVLVKVHEQVALAALVAIAAHGLLLLGDKWLNPGIGGILIPFTMPYRPVWTGIGMVAGYLAFALGLTFYVRRRIGPARWRKVHRLMALVYVMGAVHALGAGSDGGGFGCGCWSPSPRCRSPDCSWRATGPATDRPASPRRRAANQGRRRDDRRGCALPVHGHDDAHRGLRPRAHRAGTGATCWASTGACRASGPTASCRD